MWSASERSKKMNLERMHRKMSHKTFGFFQVRALSLSIFYKIRFDSCATFYFEKARVFHFDTPNSLRIPDFKEGIFCSFKILID